MISLIQGLFSESLKFIYSKASQKIILIVLFLQGLLTYFEVRQLLSIGLDATPQTHPQLIEAVPPVEYIGFNSVLFGLMAIVILGAIHGASEYKQHCLRTSLLAINKKTRFFLVKSLIFLLNSWVISFIAITSTIYVAHLTLGNSGLGIFLSPTVWKFILFGTVAWTGLTMLAFMMAFLFRTPIIPLLFLVPQIYNLGNFLAQRFEIAKLLPVFSGNGLIATSEKALSAHPNQNILLLLAWMAMFGFLAYLRFWKSDVSGEY